MRRRDVARFGFLGALSLAGCGKVGDSTSSSAQSSSAPIIAIDGSSTVFPITEAVAEEFQKINRARITVGVSGTGGGFKKFCANETVISGATKIITGNIPEDTSKAR